MFILVELKKGRRGHERKYERSRVVLGSDLRCQVWIPDSGAAPEHVEISEREGRLHLRTLPGAAPVRVNGAESAETPLADGDRVGIGRAEFQVQGPYRAQSVQIPWSRIAWGSAILLVAWIAFVKLSRTRAPSDRPPVAPPPVREALPAPEAIPVKTAVEPAPAAGRDPDERAQRALALAQSWIAQGQLEEADKILSNLQTENSGFLPAYSERAALFEKRGDPHQARAQWMEILVRAQSAESSETHRAANELARMAAEEFPRYSPPPAPAPRRTARIPPEAPAENITIQSAVVRRLPPGQNEEDVRVLEIGLKLSSDSPPVPLEEASVLVRFYDRTDPTGRVRLSSVPMNPQTLPLGSGFWTPGSTLPVTASYNVPKGLREQDTRTHGGATSYFGYSIEVRVGQNILARLYRPPQLKIAIYGKR